MVQPLVENPVWTTLLKITLFYTFLLEKYHNPAVHVIISSVFYYETMLLASSLARCVWSIC
jgi:hypothetical protein